MEQKKNNNRSILYVIITILLVFNLGLFYLWQTGKNERKVLTDVNKEITEDNKAKDQAIAAAEDLIAQYRQDSLTLAENNIQISEELAKKSNEVARLAFLLKKEKKNNSDLVEDLNNRMKELMASLVELEEKNAMLTEQNDSLRSQNQDLYREKNNLALEGKKLRTLASRITASEIKLDPLKKTFFTGSEKSTVKASRVKAIRISFSLNANNLAAKGTKDIFVKVTGPEGITLAKPGQGGIVELLDGTSTKYSLITSVEYEAETKQVPAIIWQPSGKLTEGKYTVELFTEGYLLGSAAIDLR